MSAADKFTSWIDNLSQQWKERIRGFLVSIVEIGFDAFFKLLGKSLAPKLAPLINRIKATGEVPPELSPLLEEIINPTGETGAMIGNAAVGSVISGAIGKILDGFLLPLAYAVNRLTLNVIPDANQWLAMWLRQIVPEDNARYNLHSLGYRDNNVNNMKRLLEVLFNPDQAISLWRRGVIDESALNTELKKQGLTDQRIEGVKKLATILPSASDIIRFAVREVYTPDIAKKFGQFEGFPTEAMPDANTIGFSQDLLMKYWAAHWELPAANQGFTMLHRGIISYDDLKVLLRALDVMPYWRDKVIQMAYNPYTRVDARRMWDMGVLDDTSLKRTYLDLGFDDKHADNMVTWTKVYQTYPDLIARYKNGYINLDDVRSELSKLGVSDTLTNWLIETKIKKLAPERTAKERDLTKAEIIKGYYKGVIDKPTCIEMLTDLGYDKTEANFIITINMPVEETKTAQAQRQLTKADIINGLKKGTITEADAMSKLVGIRYTPDDAAYLIKLAKATATTVTETKQRELTKADIVKGVKNGLISPEDGYLMLQDIGYSPDDAAFILMLSGTIPTGSPDSYADFKALTQVYRESQGLPAKEVPVDLQQAERNMIAAKAALDFVKSQNLDTTDRSKYEKAVSDTTLIYTQLLKKYKEKR